MNSSEKKSGWLLPSPRKSQALRAGLYVVATPIGNLGDMTVRGLDALAGADVVLCEDTRVTGKLLKSFDIKASMRIYNDHSDDQVRARIVADITAGQSIALVSDAGTPLISDPGYKLLEACRDAGLYVTPLPGANAVLTALQLSGMPSDAFSFIGFLPSKSGARQGMLERWRGSAGSLVAYDTAPRLVKSLADIDAVMGDRQVSLVREMTKLYEEVRTGSAAELMAHYEEAGLPKGEIVLVIGPPGEDVMSDEEIRSRLLVLLDEMGVKEASGAVAEQSGRAKKDVYNLALEVKRDG